MFGFNFLQYPVYLSAKDLCLSLDGLCIKLKSENNFVYSDQLSRAKLSVVLNIAEGFSRYTKPDFNRFMSIATGSLYEVIACIDIFFEFGHLKSEERDCLLQRAQEIIKQLSALRKGTK